MPFEPEPIMKTKTRQLPAVRPFLLVKPALALIGVGLWTMTAGAQTFTTLSQTTSAVGGTGAGTMSGLIQPRPILTIFPSGTHVVLAWPTNATGFALEFTTNLGPTAVWTTNATPPVIIGGQNIVADTTAGARKFYRLISQ
jgi:hypothetical protein